MPMTFHDRTGKPAAYTEDDVHIFFYSGAPAGYSFDGAVYTYPGRHLGTIRTGWVRDHDGRCVFFTDEALNSSLPQPEKLAKPPKLIKKPKPAKGRRETPPPRPADLDEWSELSGEGFFKP
ncbi:MAG TPA: hypothetical protein DD490_31075 [Acidobacteria bacterium]|nr:hypothetical protein [Acidobacteriota bacterium]